MTGVFAAYKMLKECLFCRGLVGERKMRNRAASQHNIRDLEEIASLGIQRAGKPDNAARFRAECLLVGSVEEKLHTFQNFTF